MELWHRPGDDVGSWNTWRMTVLIGTQAAPCFPTNSLNSIGCCSVSLQLLGWKSECLFSLLPMLLPDHNLSLGMGTSSSGHSVHGLFFLWSLLSPESSPSFPQAFTPGLLTLLPMPHVTLLDNFNIHTKNMWDHGRADPCFPMTLSSTLQSLLLSWSALTLYFLWTPSWTLTTTSHFPSKNYNVLTPLRPQL